MVLVYSSIDIDAIPFAKNLLIGQLSETLCDGNKTILNYIIFDSVPIKSYEVIVEQIECLEKVLPPGLVVLGVASSKAYSSSTITSCLSILLESFRYSDFVYIQLGHDEPRVTFCSDPGLHATFSNQGAIFCTISCIIHFSLPSFPFLLTRSGDKAEKILIDPQSTKCILPQVNFGESYSLFQLGGSSFFSEETMLVLPFFSSLPHLSGKSFYNCIARWMKKITKTTDIISVFSRRNPNLVYACQLNRGVPCSDTFTQVILHELRELLEDATGESIESNQLTEPTMPQSLTPEEGEITPKNKESHSFMLIFATGIVIMAIVITILMSL
ncbi:unnamed protein product [Phytomonas sp. Hart1]|nr:unnamed protein product [Phytomonas sp. Hart1]|eukprot:CCW71157.1 unnamed protein product [Phytomonas sp. isolate Hart1]